MFRGLVAKLGYRLAHRVRAITHAAGLGSPVLDLRGDRDIEWSWVAANLPKSTGRVLDFGCGDSPLGLIAARSGYKVTSIDLQDITFLFEHPDLNFIRANILSFDFSQQPFDVIINCSSIEHVGLKGRYGSPDVPDGDLEAMECLRGLLKSDGIMILTLPIGHDTVIRPLHRVYGLERLPRLLKGFTVRRKEFWIKNRENVWLQASESEALSVVPTRSLYVIGLYVLQTAAP